MSALNWLERSERWGTLLLDTNLYPPDVVFRAAYELAGHCTVFTEPGPESTLRVRLSLRDGSSDLAGAAEAFATALVDHRLRADIRAETAVIRDLIVTQAFCEADLLDHSQSEADYRDDPRRIADADHDRR